MHATALMYSLSHMLKVLLNVQVRVIHMPLLSKALITHTAPILEHSLKFTQYMKSDTERGAVMASIDTTGLLYIAAFEHRDSLPDSEDGSAQKAIPVKKIAMLQFADDFLPDADTKRAQVQPVTLLEVGTGCVYVTSGNKLLCVDTEEVVLSLEALEHDVLPVSIHSLPTGTLLTPAMSCTILYGARELKCVCMCWRFYETVWCINGLLPTLETHLILYV